MTSLFSSGRTETTFAEIVQFVAEQEAINKARTEGVWKLTGNFDDREATTQSEIVSGTERVIGVQVSGYEWDYAYVDIADKDAAFIAAASEHYGPMLKVIKAQMKAYAELTIRFDALQKVLNAVVAPMPKELNFPDFQWPSYRPWQRFGPYSPFDPPPRHFGDQPPVQPGAPTPIYSPNTAASNPPPPLAFTFNNISATADQIPPLTGVVGTATGDE